MTMIDLSIYEMRELSALRFGLSLGLKEIQKNKNMIKPNPCFLTNAEQMLMQCIASLDKYALENSWYVENQVYERR